MENSRYVMDNFPSSFLLNIKHNLVISTERRNHTWNSTKIGFSLRNFECDLLRLFATARVSFLGLTNRTKKNRLSFQGQPVFKIIFLRSLFQNTFNSLNSCGMVPRFGFFKNLFRPDYSFRSFYHFFIQHHN